MGGPRGKKKVDSAKMDQYKEVCPPNRLKDLDALVKSLKGKDAEIMEKIQEWWNEKDDEATTPVEPEWESVDKRSAKKKQQQQQQQQQSGRSGGRGSGRSGRASYRGGGGRGSGPSDRRGRSRRSPPPSKSSPPPAQEEPMKQQAEVNGGHDVPTPVVTAPAPKGAWGNRGATMASSAEPAALAPPSPAAAPVTPLKPETPDKLAVDVGVVAPQDPTPSGLNPSTPIRAASATPGGNVWATKGSAHLIQAEKPKPPPPPTPTPPRQQHMRLPPQSTEPPKSPATKQSLEPEPEPPLAPPPLDPGLSSTLSGMNTTSWNASSAPPLEMTQSSSSVAEATLSSIGAPEVSVVQEPSPAMSPAKPPPAAPAPTNVLNMGHWESGEGDESQHLDFGFGSFGPESSSAEEPATQAQAPMAASKETTTTMSPARPPPGLSIGGMPPMPANAVLVHELEGKLESATLGKPEEQADGPKPITSNLPSASEPPPTSSSQPATPSAPPGTMSQNYNTAYAGMYNYNNAAAQPSGFMGAPAGLAMPPQQKPQTGIPGPQQAPVSGGGGIPQHLQQQPPPPAGLYGSAAPSTGTPGVDSTTAPSSTDNSTTGGLPPPGMPNAMPYNPALFYQQQPYQMGQPHGGVGYGYGYGAQFGGAAGFAYGQQVMGQSGGYPYDDQPPPGRNDYPSKSNSRYPRNSGNQYQNQFNPQQHGGYGYGGQPMGGYNIDHFNQRGGYGHGPPTDPYGMPQQQGSSNYSGDKKGGRFQQQHQQLGGGGSQDQQQHQQSAFLGGSNESSSSNAHPQGGSGGGWSNNNNTSNSNQGGGGWGQPSSAWQGSS